MLFTNIARAAALRPTLSRQVAHFSTTRFAMAPKHHKVIVIGSGPAGKIVLHFIHGGVSIDVVLFSIQAIQLLSISHEPT